MEAFAACRFVRKDRVNEEYTYYSWLPVTCKIKTWRYSISPVEITPTDDSSARSLVSAGRHVTVTGNSKPCATFAVFIYCSLTSVGFSFGSSRVKTRKNIQTDVWLCFSLQITEAVIYRFVTMKMFFRGMKLTWEFFYLKKIWNKNDC